MTPRNIHDTNEGDSLYIPVIDHKAGLLNDPVLLKISNDQFWLSIADSGLLFDALGLSIGYGYNVEIDEPDISPLAVQGSKSEDVLSDIFGDRIRKLKFFKFGIFDFKGKQ